MFIFLSALVVLLAIVMMENIPKITYHFKFQYSKELNTNHVLPRK
jgi:hypothetical protein